MHLEQDHRAPAARIKLLCSISNMMVSVIVLCVTTQIWWNWRSLLGPISFESLCTDHTSLLMRHHLCLVSVTRIIKMLLYVSGIYVIEQDLTINLAHTHTHTHTRTHAHTHFKVREQFTHWTPHVRACTYTGKLQEQCGKISGNCGKLQENCGKIAGNCGKIADKLRCCTQTSRSLKEQHHCTGDTPGTQTHKHTV